MFCPECKCKYVDWLKKCPGCDANLVKELPPEINVVNATLPYDELVAMVQENQQLQIDLHTTKICREKHWTFPYLGFGYAWAHRMEGEFSGLLVELNADEVGMDRKWMFPYQGYGYAWVKKMRGFICGNEVNLDVTKIEKKAHLAFPYRGYGFAWAEKMSGMCGKHLKVEMLTTDLGEEKQWGFPYFGFGFAWANKCSLVLTYKE